MKILALALGTALCFGLALGFGVPSLASAMPQGPVELSNQHPLAALHLSFQPEAAQLIAPGAIRIRGSGVVSNTVNREKGSFLIDTESRELLLDLRYAPSDALELNLRPRMLYRGGGFTDHLIDEWHTIFGLPRGPRSRIPEDEFYIGGENSDGSEFRLEEQGTSLGDLDLGAKLALLKSSKHHLSLAVSLRLPTAKDGFGQDGFDASLGLLFDFRLRNSLITLGNGLLYLQDAQAGNLRFTPWRNTTFASIDIPLLDRLSLVTGLLFETGFLDDVQEYPEYQLYLDAGFRYALTDALMLEISLRENPTPDDATVDFTFLTALTAYLP